MYFSPAMWHAYALFACMIFVPVGYDLIKFALLFVVLGAILAKHLAGQKIEVHPEILLGMLFFTSLGLAYTTYGVAENNPGGLLFAKLYVVYPLVYLLMIAGLTEVAVLRKLTGVMVIATGATGLYGIIYVLHWFGLWPDYLFVEIEPEHQKAGWKTEGFFKFSLYSITSLAFLVPYLITAALTWKDREVPVARYWFWLAVFIGLAALVASGRRTLMILMAIPFLIAILFKSPSNRVSRKRLAAIAVLLFAIPSLIFVYFQSPVAALESIESSYGVRVRVEQAGALLREWQESPIFGHGLGAEAGNYVRSETDRWSYELSYLLLLMNTGIVGILCYAAGIAWIYIRGFRLIKTCPELATYMLPCLSGLTVVLLANAGNPYFNNFSFFWFIYLPVSVINLWMTRKYRVTRLVPAA